MGSDDWTDVRVRVLRRHWGKGKSASAIAEMIGMSRSAVIGKAHRLGLAKRASPIKPRAEGPELRRRAPRPGRKLTLVPKPELSAAPEPCPGPRIPMAQLTATTCRYPYGERTSELLFCGAPAIEGKAGWGPYCAYHDELCHRPRQQAAATDAA